MRNSPSGKILWLQDKLSCNQVVWCWTLNHMLCHVVKGFSVRSGKVFFRTDDETLEDNGLSLYAMERNEKGQYAQVDCFLDEEEALGYLRPETAEDWSNWLLNIEG